MTGPSDGDYRASQNLDFTITFNESITVTGTPRLSLTVGSTARYATYSSGSGSATLTFRHTVGSSDTDTDGIAFAATSIDLNSGTLKDSADNNAGTNFSSIAPTISGVNVDTTAPTLSGLADDSTWKKSKTWSWSCSETCTYRFTVDTTSNTSPTGPYIVTTSASQSSGTGTYYLHVQAKDGAGNTSAVTHVSTKIDNTAPTLTGTPTLSDNATDVQAATINWSSLTRSDSNSGVDKIEIAVGKDSDSSGSLSDTEKSNVISWGTIPNGLTLNPKEYQIVDQVDSFNSVSLSGSDTYYTSLRVVDAAGNSSTAVTTSSWQRLYLPSEHANIQFWLDSQDMNTLYQTGSCSSAVTSDDDPVGCWQDKSNNDNHSIQTTSNKMPSYNATDRSITFDGSNDFYGIRRRRLLSLRFGLANYDQHSQGHGRNGNPPMALCLRKCIYPSSPFPRYIRRQVRVWCLQPTLLRRLLYHGGSMGPMGSGL